MKITFFVSDPFMITFILSTPFDDDLTANSDRFAP